MKKLAGLCALLAGGCLETNKLFVEPPVTETTSEGTGTDSTGQSAPPTTGETATTTGSIDSTDASTLGEPETTTPIPAECGDGSVHPSEACDDGNKVDDDECTNYCTVAACGDGVQHKGAEACDDGNQSNSDACLNSCAPALCGDGELWLGVETCDDGNVTDEDGCDSDCRPTVRHVFVTSEVYRASELGGLEGADLLCQKLAMMAQLPVGQYLAWLSTDAESPSTRFTPSDWPYVRTDRVPVAMNWDDLIDGKLLVPIELDEFGGPGPKTEMFDCLIRGVHSNTTEFGTPVGEGSDCVGWTNDEYQTQWGSHVVTGAAWTQACQVSCFNEAPIYCFQQ